MLKRLPCVVLCLAVLCIGMRAAPPNDAIVSSWSYDQNSKILTIHLQNVSGRHISAYSMSVSVRYADGSVQTSEFSNDYLPRMASVNIAPSLRKKYGDGAFLPGTTHNEGVFSPAPKVADVLVKVDVVAYTDATAQVQNQQAFNQLLARRKAEVLAFQKASATIAQSSDSKAAAEEIGRLADAAKKESTLNDPQTDLETALRHLATRAQTTNLKRLAQDLQARIAFYAAHTELKEVQ
ncbi:MAG TPA: hypothetical protein VHM93_00290 [Candidatus Acidoferrum sp.]|jgi:hypothetical protein|nr:hypothetical protein [Candidatus Acidoferrum sp.]